jgi:hypothetical protein
MWICIRYKETHTHTHKQTNFSFIYKKMMTGINLRLLKSQWEEVEINKKRNKKNFRRGVSFPVPFPCYASAVTSEQRPRRGSYWFRNADLKKEERSTYPSWRNWKTTKKLKRSNILGPYITYGLFPTKGELCAKFSSDLFRNVNLYEVQTHTHTHSALYIRYSHFKKL